MASAGHVDAHLEAFDDTTQRLALVNLTDRPVRVWQVALYDCVNVRHGCGATIPRRVVASGGSATLATLTVEKNWRAYWGVIWRPAPPTDAAMFELTARASGPATLLVAPLALARVSYRPFEANYSFRDWEMVDLRQRIAVWVEQHTTPEGDSLQIELMAARIPIDSSGRLLADDGLWIPIERSDSIGAKTVADLGQRIRDAELHAAVHPLDTTDALHAGELRLPPRTKLALAPRNLGGGRWALCRYSTGLTEVPLVVDLARMDDWCPSQPHVPALHFNAFVVANPVLEPIGKMLETCAAYTTRIPGGWEPVEWHSDPQRCPADGPAANSQQPNILVLVRRR